MRRGLIRFGAAAVSAGVIALVVPGTATPQFGNLTVSTTADGNDGECQRDCTLREAIALADQSTGQWVALRPGVYRLTLGPLTLTNDTVFGVSFAGNFSSGARSTIIEGRDASQVINVPDGSSSILAGVTVTGGRAPNGGGIQVADGGQLTLYDTIVRDNSATGRGGGIHAAGTLSLLHSTVSGNSAPVGGGIAGEANGGLGLFNATVSGNSASSNGGGIATSSSTTLQRVTFANNSAPTGGGLYVEPGPSPPGTGMWSTLFDGNSGGACGGATSGRFPWSANISDDASCAFAPGEGANSTDPLTDPLDNNGGPTDTHAIPRASAAVNAGDSNLCGPNSPDQRHAPAIGACDIGAYEFGATPPAADLPPPEAGETVNVNESRGRVRVKIPGSDEFFELEDAQQVPVGSTFDTSRGRVNLVAAGQQKSWFYKGVFKLGQTRGAKPLSTLTLTGRLACGNANAAAKRKRRLWGDGKGKFRTKGKHSAATVVGTRWLVEDRCNGTLTRVTKGTVRVRDFGARKNVVVKAGRRYFARAR